MQQAWLDIEVQKKAQKCGLTKKISAAKKKKGGGGGADVESVEVAGIFGKDKWGRDGRVKVGCCPILGQVLTYTCHTHILTYIHPYMMHTYTHACIHAYIHAYMRGGGVKVACCPMLGQVRGQFSVRVAVCG